MDVGGGRRWELIVEVADPAVGSGFLPKFRRVSVQLKETAPLDIDEGREELI